MKNGMWRYVFCLAGLLACALLLAPSKLDAQDMASSAVAAPIDTGGWLNYQMDIPEAGRYRCQISAALSRPEPITVWLEEAPGDPDAQPVRISGDFLIKGNAGEYLLLEITDCHLSAGPHWIRIRFSKGGVAVNSVRFSRLPEPGNP